MKLLIAALLVAVMLLYGCSGPQNGTGANAPVPDEGAANGGAGTISGGSNEAGAGGAVSTGTTQQGDIDTAFSELDTFAGADVEVTEPDAGLGDFSLNESQLG